MNEFATRKGWELEHTGGGNYCFIRDMETKQGQTVCIFVCEYGASIPLFDDESFKTLEQYKEDYTEAYLEIVDWMEEAEGYILSTVNGDKAKSLFTDEQLQEMKETCEQLDKYYGY